MVIRAIRGFGGFGQEKGGRCREGNGGRRRVAEKWMEKWVKEEGCFWASIRGNEHRTTRKRLHYTNQLRRTNDESDRPNGVFCPPV
jgi:hypothetical protein